MNTKIRILLPYYILALLIFVGVSFKFAGQNTVTAVSGFFITLVLAIFFFAKGKIHLAFLTLLLGMGVPSDVFRYLIIITAVFLILIFNRQNIFKDKDEIKIIKKVFYYILILLSFTYTLNIFIYRDPWGYPLFLVTFISSVFLMIQVSHLKLPENIINKFASAIISVFAIHIIITLILPILTGRLTDYTTGFSSISVFSKVFFGSVIEEGGFTGDVHTSILSSSNEVGMVCSILFVFFLSYFFTSKKIKFLILSALALFCFFLTDTKLMYPITAFGTLLCLWQLKSYIRFFLMKSIPYLAVIIITLFIIMNFETITGIFKGVGQSYTEEVNNPKLTLYQRCIAENMANPVAFFVGRGPGVFGSRVSNSRATDVLAKGEIKLPDFIPEFSLPDYSNVMEGLYTFDFLNASKSGAMMNPFASFICIIMEFGLIGAFLFFFILFKIYNVSLKMIKEKDLPIFWKVYAATANFYILYILFASFFDQYLEKPVSAFFFWSFLGVMLLKYNNINSQSSIVKNIDK